MGEKLLQMIEKFCFFSREIGWICNTFTYSNKKLFISETILLDCNIAKKYLGKQGIELFRLAKNKQVKSLAKIFPNWFFYHYNTKIVYSLD